MTLFSRSQPPYFSLSDSSSVVEISSVVTTTLFLLLVLAPPFLFTTRGAFLTLLLVDLTEGFVSGALEVILVGISEFLTRRMGVATSCVEVVVVMVSVVVTVTVTSLSSTG